MRRWWPHADSHNADLSMLSGKSREFLICSYFVQLTSWFILDAVKYVIFIMLEPFRAIYWKLLYHSRESHSFRRGACRESGSFVLVGGMLRWMPSSGNTASGPIFSLSPNLGISWSEIRFGNFRTVKDNRRLVPNSSWRARLPFSGGVLLARYNLIIRK